MNLVLDIGNTFSKYYIFKFDKITSQGFWKTLDVIQKFKIWIKNNQECESIIISDVFGVNISFFESKTKCKIVWISSSINLPFKISYKTPETIGADRLSLIAAAAVQYPKKNCLVIDLGTCITYDFINDKGVYLGGSISPGFSIRYMSLNKYTSKLPKLEFSYPNNILGNSTENSIHSGVYFGVLGEIKNQISDYESKFQNLTVILTGGDAHKLSKQIKNSIFANHIFLANGLFAVLKLNIVKF